MDFDEYLIDEVNILIKKKLEQINRTYNFIKPIDELYSKFKISTISIIEPKVKQIRKSSEIPINRCQGRIWAKGKTIEEVKPGLEKQLYSNKRTQELNTLLTTLKETYTISENEALTKPKKEENTDSASANTAQESKETN